MNECLNCGKSVKNKYCNVSCQNKHQNPLRKKERIVITKQCLKCKEDFNLEIIKNGSRKKEKEYCSNKCARSRVWSDEDKEKKREAMKNKTNKSQEPNLKCINCETEYYRKPSKVKGSKYCSLSCSTEYRNNHNNMAHNAGLKSAQSQSDIRRSKNEILFAEKCINYFDKVLTNEPIFNGWDADVIIEDFKIAVMWNGIWHYEKITEKHSVEQVQNRDRIKIKEIKQKGYTPYIIKDLGKYNTKKVEREFNIFLGYIKSKDII